MPFAQISSDYSSLLHQLISLERPLSTTFHIEKPINGIV